MTRLSLVALGFVLLAVACSSDGTLEPDSVAGTAAASEEIIVIRASSDLAVGSERLLIALAAPNGDRLGSPGQEVSMEVFSQEAPSETQTLQGTWMWAIPDVSGLYRATVDFDRPGTWIAQISLDGDPLEPIAMTVLADPSTPAIGELAPASDTPTSAGGVALDAISTDPNPAPAFYELSIAEAVASGRSTVVAFATPKFCQTAICGPTLEGLKEMQPNFPDVNFVHVEVFDLEASGDAQTLDELVVHPSVTEWGLPSEPWVFVVDAKGVVIGRFEGVVSQEEIEELI